MRTTSLTLKRLKGTETDHKRALSFYATSVNLDTLSKDISVQGRIKALVSNVNLSHLADLNISAIFEAYWEQLFDPTNWNILHFHNSTGCRLNGSTAADDAQILLPVGRATENMAAGNRREVDISFVQEKAVIDLSELTKWTGRTYDVTTFIKLPCGNLTIKDGAGTDIVVNEFLGNNDKRICSSAEFKMLVLDVTRQSKVAGLQQASFGMTKAILKVDDFDKDFWEELIKGEMSWLTDILFQCCCPGTSFRPLSALHNVKKCITNGNGNTTHLSVHLYFANLQMAMGCMGKTDYEIDVVSYAVNNMDPDIRAQIEGTYAGHLSPHKRNPLTQTRGLQELLCHATTAEKTVLETHAIASRSTQSVLAAVPGLSVIGSHLLPSTDPAGILPSSVPTTRTSSADTVNSSVAERTIQDNTPIFPFTWVWGSCVACGEKHRYKKGNEIICPNIYHPGAKENVVINYEKIKAAMEKHEGGDGSHQKRWKMEKSQWNRFINKAKKAFTKNLLSDPSLQEEFNRYAKWAKNEPKPQGTYGPAGGDVPPPPPPPSWPPPPPTSGGAGGRGITLLPTITVLNLMEGAPPLLPVRLDAELPHIAFRVGGCEANNTTTKLITLVVSGAGATISLLLFFEAIVLINPDMLVRAYTYKG